MTKAIIRCHPSPGWDTICRAGRAWPASGTEVEILDQENDREAGNGKPLGIGTRSLAEIREDKRFSIDASIAEMRDAAARVLALEAENASLQERISKLEEELAAAKATDSKPKGAKKD